MQVSNNKTFPPQLVKTGFLGSDDDGLISQFVRYEAIRSGGRSMREKLGGSKRDHLHILLWYISEYNLRWGPSVQIPLSETQVKFLNEPMPVDSFPESISVVLWNFLIKERPDLSDVADPDVEREAVYWWCFEKSRQLKFENRLITSAQADLLSRCNLLKRDIFPITDFMIMHINKTVELQCLNLSSNSGRLAALHYFFVLALKFPYMSSFLPRSTLKAIVQQQSKERSYLQINLDFLMKDLPDRVKISEYLHRAGKELFTLSSDPEAGENYGHDAGRNDPTVAKPSDGINLIGPIEKTSGLGQATRMSYRVLKQSGSSEPSVLPFNVENPALVGFSTQVKFLPYAQPRKFNLLHLNAEAIPLAFAFEDFSVFKDSYNIGYFFWELNKMPESHLLALDLLDEIWVSSDYVRNIYSAQTNKPVKNVGMAVEDLPADLISCRTKPSAGTFTFLATFDSFSFVERKNPLSVIKAFQLAFEKTEGSVKLIIKTWNKNRVSDLHQVRVWKEIEQLIASDDRISVVDNTLAYRELLFLKDSCDCYVSLHRAEGFGFGMLEAMQLGKAVIATAYSGNMDFCTEENSYLVDYELIPVGYDEYPAVERGSVWADPNVRSAAAAMRDVVMNRQKATAKGIAAAQFVKDNYSVAAISGRYRARLAELGCV